MTFFEWITSFFKIPRRKSTTSFDYDFNASESIYDGRSYTYTSDGKKIRNAEYDMAWHPTLRRLATFNQDVSLAVDNIVNLASQSHEIYFNGVSQAQERKMRAFLETKVKTLYPYSFGLTSLINDLLRQLSISGCISVDYILDSRLRISRVALVRPENIYFIDEGNGLFVPYQKLNYLGGAVSQYKKLNEATFKYITLQRDSEQPYPIPPFIAAIDSLDTQGSGLGNLKVMMRRMGLFGFLSVMLNAPKPKQGEPESVYQNRLIAFLDAEGARVQKLMNKDYVVGFKDTHDFKLENGGVDAKNAGELMKILDTLVMAGLKQDPAMMGREKNTSEAFGRVLLAKMITQITTYQAIVASFLENLFLTLLRLEGFNIADISVVFKEPILKDELNKEQAYSAKIDNLLKLYSQGIISQQQFASEAGYDIAFSEAPLQQTPQVETSQTPQAKVEIKLQPFDLYSVPTDYANEVSNTPYYKQIAEIYEKSIRKLGKKIKKELEGTNTNLTTSELQEKVFSLLALNWQKDFVDECEGTISKQVTKIYSKARKDKTIFPESETTQNSFNDDIPNAVFELLDYRTIEFLKLMDAFYLGKFVINDDTKKRLYEYLKANYIESDTPIGQNPQAIEDIKRAFEELMGLEGYKIARIINTSVNRMRAFGNINYMSQAQIEKYRIVEVMDRITCPHCKVMNGKEFSVSNARTRLSTLVEGEPEDVQTLFPFATQISVQDLSTLSDTDLQDLNISLPAFHPNCRGTTVAVL